MKYKVCMISPRGYEPAISCDLPSYKAALAWVREHWTRDGEQLTPVRIVAI